MIRNSILALALALGGGSSTSTEALKAHQDFVPDKTTAVRIAEAVLTARYGEQFVKANTPLLVMLSHGDTWIAQAHNPGAEEATGGGPAVWIDKNTGCLDVMDRMK